ADEGRIAECRFEQATVPFALAYDEPRKSDYVARLRERDWSPAAARFALVGWTNPRISTEPRWIATDTCEPFVFDTGDFKIDLRELVRDRP
ncbi:hypothetical protein, partial [Allosphingosinicella sp.]|uniref:hypothetical protein n=1 Tax=Allosphingosinicella sp. TaxID=2823234 RepID=UPI002EFDD3CA